jgi:hypothetical protein
VLAVALPVPAAPVAVMVQLSPALPTGSDVEPAHARGPLLGEVPVQAYVHDVASVQFHVIVAAAPHAGGGPNEAVQRGTGVVQPLVADALWEPPGPVALMVQLSPAAPTVRVEIEPAHATGPLLGEVPVQMYVHAVASAQFHVIVAAPPHTGGAPNAAEQRGAETHETMAVALSVPLGLDALMVQLSPVGPTVNGCEPAHGTEPLVAMLPVQA